MEITREGWIVAADPPCRGKEDALLSLSMGSLSAQAAGKLIEHVERCPRCASYLRLREAVDEGFRDCLLEGREKHPEEMPRRVRVLLSGTRRKNLGLWLFEVGRALLFQREEAADTINPETEPIALRECLERTGRLLETFLEDPFREEAGLSRKWIEAALGSVRGVKEDPARLLDIEGAIEFLERALFVLPKSGPVFRFLGHCRRLSGNLDEARSLYARSFDRAGTEGEKKTCLLLLAEIHRLKGEFEMSFRSIDLAGGIQDDFETAFHRFMNHCGMRDPARAAEALGGALKKLDSGPPGGIDPRVMSLFGKWILRNGTFLRVFFEGDPRSLERISSLAAF